MALKGIQKIDAMLTILRKLDSRNKITVLNLANELSVSERSIYRYLKALQSAGYPIFFDKEQNSYSFVETFKLGYTGHTTENITTLDLKKRLFSTSSIGIAAYKIDGTCVFVNKSLLQMINATKQQVMDANFNNIRSWRESGLLELVNNVINSNVELSRDIHLSHYISKELWAHFIVSPLENKKQRFIFIMAIDISMRKQNELALSTFAHSISKGPNFVMITDRSGNIEYVSDKIYQITGYSPDEVIGANPRIFQSGMTLPSVYINLWEAITNGQEWVGELRNRRKDGSTYWEHVLISPIVDDFGNISRFVAVKEDVTRHKHLEEELYRHATSDSLTGLYNKLMFMELARREMKLIKRYKEALAIMIIDIDNFKRINDEYGYEAGEDALRAVAQACRVTLRSSDILARIGGDEFSLLLSGTDAGNSVEVAGRLLRTIENIRLNWKESILSFTVSIGVSELFGDETSLEILLDQANQAAYKAKHNGGNQVVVIDDCSNSEKCGSVA